VDRSGTQVAKVVQRRRPVSITDVATQAGVSVTTVSHVLSGRRPVAQITRGRVLRIIAELGYEPNQLARSLRMRRSHTIALIIPDITNPFYPSVARGLQDVVGPAGYHVIVSNTDADPGTERAVLRQMVTRAVDGIGFAGYYSHVDLAPAVAVGIPVVLLGGHKPVPGIDALSTDDVLAGKLATAYLIGRGHQRIGFITGPPGEGPPAERVAGYRRALAEAGIRPLSSLVNRQAFSRVGGARGMAELMDLTRPPQAVICTNDIVAIGALDTARERGLRVPGEVAIMGFDDIEAASLISPSLTTVSIAPVEQGRALGRLLVARLDGPLPEGPQRLLFEPVVVPRESA
jgi:LacI family transcriptional regulator